MSKKVKLEHDLLDSQIATAVALYNEWIKWCLANDILARKIPTITSLFEVSEKELKDKE